jgi:outer membrane lipoprotein-sorting protein
MMKKLLVLLIILVLASVANAAMSLSIDGVNPSDGTEDIEDLGGTVTVYVLDSTGGSSYTYYLDMLKVAGGGKATMAYPSVYTEAGDLAEVSGDYSTTTLYDYELFAGDSGGNVLTGRHFSSVITESGSVGDTFNVELIDYGVATLDTITFTIVPEPMTIALLGLGGLFLRRRK